MLSARLVLNTAEQMLREGIPGDEVDAMLTPPTREEQLAERAAQLQALGVV